MFRNQDPYKARRCEAGREPHPQAERAPILELDDNGIYQAVLPHRRRAEHYMARFTSHPDRPAEGLDSCVFLG